MDENVKVLVRTITHPWLRPLIWRPPFQLPDQVWQAGEVHASFDVRPHRCPTHLKPWTEHTVLRNLLLCAGIAQSPSTAPNEPSSWGFLVEHLQSFASRPGTLRAIDAAASWDSRIQGLFAERLGMGLAAWLLWHNFDVLHIADAGPFIGSALADPLSPYNGLSLVTDRYGKLRPDYFCLTSSGEVVIAEAKGAIGRPSNVIRRVKKAKQQVRNVTPTGTGIAVRRVEGRIVFATNIRVESDAVRSAKHDTGVHVEDPDENDNSIHIPMSADALVVAAYCKILHFLGLGWVTPFFRRGIRPLISPSSAVESIHGERILVLGEVLGIRVGLLASVARALFIEEAEQIHTRVSGALQESQLLRARGELRDLALALPNGVLAMIP